MSEFSASWLRLREPVDQRSRNPAVASALREAFATRRDIKVVDIGCGTGANLRAAAELLGPRQDWTLVDNDRALLDRAGDALRGWADTATSTADGLTLSKNRETLTVRFRHADIASDIGGALGEEVDLVTASAFFDLVSQGFIDRLVAAVRQRDAALHAILTYDGVQHWVPSHADDQRIGQAFNAHQEGDKGFGRAVGSRGPEFLAEACGAAGLRMVVGDSRWCLGPDDDALLRELTEGVADAVTETGLVDMASIAAWRACPRSAAVIGHRDLLALPGR